MTRDRPATLRDVAAAAGLSVTTVSDALAGRGRMTEATRQRAAEAAAALHYVANSGARNLRQGRAGAVGLALPTEAFRFDYYLHLARGAAEEAHRQGLALTLLPPADRVGSQTPFNVDGIVASDPTPADPILHLAERRRLPVVTCERPPTTELKTAGHIRSDYHGAMSQLLDVLAARGADRIAILCPDDETTFGQYLGRSYRTWCARHGHPVLLLPIALTAPVAEIRGAVDRALGLGGVDAIISVPDGSAITVIHALAERGMSVPGDMRVASFVDSPALAQQPVPITAVDLAPHEMGRRAVTLLTRLIGGEARPGTTDTLPLAVQVRASSG